MAKIRRRLKNGKEVGNFGVTVKGRGWVNLETKDAKLARKRAPLAVAGRWPVPSVADEAADVARKVEHVPAEPMELPDQQAPTGAGSEGAAGAGSLPPAAPVVEPDPIAAAQAAAADVAAPLGPDPIAAGDAGPVDLAAEMGKELQREFFPEGAVGESGDPGLAGASVLFALEHAAGQRVAGRGSPPRFIPEPTKDDLLVRLTACAFRVLGRHYSTDIKVHPLYILLGVALIGYPFQMALAARTEEQIKAAAEEEKRKAEAAQSGRN